MKIQVTGCQVGGHVKKGGKEDIFTGKGGQKEDIFYQKLIQINQKCIQFTCNLSLKQFFNTKKFFLYNWPPFVIGYFKNLKLSQNCLLLCSLKH